MRELLLDFRELHGPHTGESMSQYLYDALQGLGIVAKVSLLASGGPY
jgi:hypothetical protein